MDRFDPYRDTTNLERARRAAADVGSSSSTVTEPGEPGLSAIILTLNHADFVVPLVAQLLEERARFPDVEILVGDTGSTEPKLLQVYDLWRDRGDVEIVRGLDYHFSRCNNLLAQRARREVLLFLNNDIVLSPRVDSLRTLHEMIATPSEVGIAGAMLFFPNGAVQCCGVDFFRQPPERGFPYHPFAHEHIAPDTLPGSLGVPATTGAFLAIRRDLFSRVGGFSGDYSKELQDIDLCLRVHRMGLRTQVANLGNTIHLENGTRPRGEAHWPDRRLFLRRWRSYIEAHFL